MTKKITYFLIIAITLLLSGCKTYKVGMEAAKNDPIPDKLPKLEISSPQLINDIHNNKANLNQVFVAQVVLDDLNKNFMTPSDSYFGKLDINFNTINAKKNWAPYICSAFTLFTVNILGVPLFINKLDLDIGFEIKNLNDEIIRTYKYTTSGKSVQGFYYGKDPIVLAIDQTRDIMDKLRVDINRDIDYINTRLGLKSNTQNMMYQTLANQSYTQPQPSAPVADPKPSQRILSDVDMNIPVNKSTNSNTFVLIIANEDYSFVDDVPFALNDGNTFKEYCIKTLGIPENQVWLYENATYGIINAGVSKMAQALNLFENSNAIVYYCGHGMPEEKTGDAYIIPTDGKGTNMATCYSLNTLYQTLGATKAKNVTYFMDACFSGANKEGSMLVAARGIAREPKKATISGNTVVFSAASGDETAMTYKEKQHGLFTYYLLKKLQESNGDVSYGELSTYLNGNVKKVSFLNNEKVQTPGVATSSAVKDNWETIKLR